MYGLLGFLLTYGENFMSAAPLEIHLLRKIVTCSILILPAVYRLTLDTVKSLGFLKKPALCERICD